MNERSKENINIRFGEIIKLFNENFSLFAELVYENMNLKINFKLDFLENKQEFKTISKTIKIEKDENQKIVNEKEIRKWLSEWYKLMRKKLNKLKKIINSADPMLDKWFIKQIQEKINEINAKWKKEGIKKSLNLGKDGKSLILVDKSNEKPNIIKQSFNEKHDWFSFFSQLEKQDSAKDISELNAKLHELEIEGIYFGFVVNINNVLLYDKSEKYITNGIQFQNIKDATMYIDELTKDIRCKKKDIEDKLSILNTGYKQYDYLLTGKDIIITMIQDSEINTKTFPDYDDFIDWYNQEKQNN